MRCRILYLIGQLHSGGSERQLYYLVRGLDRDRYQPAVAVWNYSENDTYVHQIRQLGLPIYSFPSTFSAFAKLTAFRSLVNQLKPQIVHSYSSYLNFAVQLSTRGLGTIAFGSSRSDFVLDWEGLSWWLGCLNARWPRKQIYNSFRAARAASQSKSLFVPRQLSVVQNGVDLNRFRMSPFPTSGGTQVIGIGSLLPVKRWDRLLIAASELKRRNYEFSVRIIGDGPLRKSLEQQVQDRCLQGKVEFLGHVCDVPSFLSDASLLVHCSDAEGCPNVIMEAMACGRAVVAMDVGDVPQLVDDGKTGFVVSSRDNAILIDRIATLILDRHLCQRMGEAGRAKAERDFGLDRLVTGTLTAYQGAGWKDASLEETGLSHITEPTA